MGTAPKPATTEDIRARYHGLGDHARSMGFQAAWIGLQGIATAVLGFLYFENALVKAAAFVVALVLFGAAIGIARALEWARWVGGVSSLLLGIAQLVLPYVQRAQGVERDDPKLPFVLVALMTGAYLLSPSTRKSFQNARNARDRALEARVRS